MVALLLAALSILSTPSAGRGENPADLKQQGYVNDFGNYIDAESSDKISDICKELERETGTRLLFVTVHSTENLSSGKFGEELLGRWIAVPELREHSMAVVISAHGNLGFSYGSAIEAVVPYEKVDSIFRASLGVGGANYGQKFVYLAQQLAEAMEGKASLWARIQDKLSSVWVLFLLAGAVLFLVVWRAWRRV
jgi:uncharacterized membrane protein YgcG